MAWCPSGACSVRASLISFCSVSAVSYTQLAGAEDQQRVVTEKQKAQIEQARDAQAEHALHLSLIHIFLLGDQKGEVLFCEREPPPLSVPRARCV